MNFWLPPAELMGTAGLLVVGEAVILSSWRPPGWRGQRVSQMCRLLSRECRHLQEPRHDVVRCIILCPRGGSQVSGVSSVVTAEMLAGQSSIPKHSWEQLVAKETYFSS